MLLQLINVLYVLVAIAMIALILMQRGAGAQAGSGFGGGASATVFGSRGSSNFLTKSTKWLGVLFFAISLGMAVYASKNAGPAAAEKKADLGVMGQQDPIRVQEMPATKLPTAPAQQAPTAPVVAPQYGQPAQAQPAAAQPQPTATAPAQPAPAQPAPQGN